MSRRRRIIIRGLLGVALLVALAGGAFSVQRASEPTYQGKAIGRILDDYARGNLSVSLEDAFTAIGTNALPYLVQNWKRRDSKWHLWYKKNWKKLPQIAQAIVPEPRPLLDFYQAEHAVRNLGSAAVPQFVALLRHSSPAVREGAARGLGVTGLALGELKIPALLAAENDPDQQVRSVAGAALSSIELDLLALIEAEAGIVTVGREISPPTGKDASLNLESGYWLKSLAPGKRNLIPTLKLAFLTGDPYLRGQAAFTLWRLDGDATAAATVLLREMASLTGPHKANLIFALGEIGPSGPATIPKLMTELRQEQSRYVRKAITNAMVKIDAETAAKLAVFPPLPKKAPVN